MLKAMCFDSIPIALTVFRLPPFMNSEFPNPVLSGLVDVIADGLLK